MITKIKAGIIGGAGYTGGELIRILINHPLTEITFVHSKSQTGKAICSVHTDLYGETDQYFTDKIFNEVDVLFLCLAHGESKVFFEQNKIPAHIKIIDLSQDHRISSTEYVYGLTELNKEGIRQATKIANPGCFATAIQLSLLPLAAEEMLNDTIHITATTGSTGAGQSLNLNSHFSWRQNNLSVYKAFEHQHLAEIKQGIKYLQKDFGHSVHFIPQRGAFTRGIMACTYLHSKINLEKAYQLFEKFYEASPFVWISKNNIDLKQVVNTNKCLLHLNKHGDQLMIVSIIDNLLKGASGQAVQNMNLMFGLEETVGLKLKAMAF